jgi:hypothetical protein
MMNEAKPFASLGPTLLARKGGARPAMRPQLSPLLNGTQQALDEDSDALDDLGWNDMGDPDEDEREKRVIPIGLSPIGAVDDDDLDDEEFDEPAPAAHVFAQEEPEDEEPEEWEPEERVPENREPEVEMAYSIPLAETPRAALSNGASNGASEPEAVRQRQSPPASFDEEPAQSRRSAIDDGRRAAFTLRLDAQRHLKLRLASTIRNRSAQQLVTQALDKFLAEIPEIEALAARVTRD